MERMYHKSRVSSIWPDALSTAGVSRALVATNPMTVGFLTSFLPGKSHHMTHSGYEQLIRYIDHSSVFYVKDFPRLSRITYPLRLARILPKSYASAHAELAALKSNETILHHLYGEDTLWLSFLRRFCERRHIIATLHRPPHVMNRTMPVCWKRSLRRLAGIIVLSPGQLSYLRSTLGENDARLALIPHGVDSEYFAPDPKHDRTGDLGLIVGTYLREYKTLAKAMRIVSGRAPSLRLGLVSRQRANISNVENFGRLSDRELLAYYRKASFVVLPFEDATASNALLEAMACGLPIVCPDLSAVRYYIGKDAPTTYKPWDYNELASKVLWLYENGQERDRLGSRMRERSELFSWDIVSARVGSFYKLILES